MAAGPSDTQIADRIACFIDARSPGSTIRCVCAPLMKLGGGVWGGDVFRGMALNAMIPHGPKDRDSPAPQSAQESLRALKNCVNRLLCAHPCGRVGDGDASHFPDVQHCTPNCTPRLLRSHCGFASRSIHLKRVHQVYTGHFYGSLGFGNLLFYWSERRDLNSGPLAPHASALPDCATLRHRGLFFLGNSALGNGAACV